MDITHLSHSGFRIKGKNSILVIDNSAVENLGESSIIFTSPGEYEVRGVKILGIPNSGKTIFKIKIDGVTFCHLGDLKTKLTDKELSSLEEVDILFVITTEAEGISQIGPKIVIPREILKEGERLSQLTISKDKLPQDLKIVILE